MFEYFLQALPPDPGVKPYDVEATPSMPPELVQFYREVGVGSFGGGVVFFHPPSELQPMLDVWVPSSPRRIPFARDCVRRHLLRARHAHRSGGGGNDRRESRRAR